MFSEINLKHELRKDVEAAIVQAFPNYHSELPESFYQAIVEDIIESSAYRDEGRWNDSDIRIGMERVLALMCGANV